jgi:hypothetical protein
MAPSAWPELAYEEWRDTKQTLQMYLQIVGKLRLALSPPEPQWSHVALYVTARGLNTSPIPHPNGVFDVDVDFYDRLVSVRTADGRMEIVQLEPKPVADFYAELMGALERAGVPVEINPKPQEVEDPIPFTEDRTHGSYDAPSVDSFHRALVSVDAVMKEHRARFRGRVSPVHFFWGSFDLSYARFSGRPLEVRPEAGVIERGGGDAEQFIAGFWPGDERMRHPAFFAYTYRKPDGVEEAEVRPEGAHWSPELGEFILPYEAVRTAPDPRQAVLDFLESTYRAGAERAGWDPALA